MSRERTRPPAGTSPLAPQVEQLMIGGDPALEVVAPAARAAPEPESAPPEPAGGPKYLQLTRRDVRLREDQLDALTALRRRISNGRGRGQREERITDSTLIRAAIDLLLVYEDRIDGATEADILTSAIRAAARRRRT